jgi:hypothetical protein
MGATGPPRVGAAPKNAHRYHQPQCKPMKLGSQTGSSMDRLIQGRLPAALSSSNSSLVRRVARGSFLMWSRRFAKLREAATLRITVLFCCVVVSVFSRQSAMCLRSNTTRSQDGKTATPSAANAIATRTVSITDWMPKQRRPPPAAKTCRHLYRCHQSARRRPSRWTHSIQRYPMR